MDAPTERTETPVSSPAPRPRRRRWPRRLMIGGGVLVLLLLVLIGLAPMIAGWIAPGIASGAITKSINGSASVERVSLSWFGGQRVGPVVIRDDKGTEVARVSVGVSRGLTGLARGALGLGGLDAGEIRIDGSAHLVREPDGRLNIERVFAPKAKATPAPSSSPAGPSEPARVPPSLAARLVIDALNVSFRDDMPGADPAARVVLLKDVRGEGVFAAGKPATLALTGSASYGPDAQSSGTPAGTVKINATADRLVDATGLVLTDQASFDATVEAADLAVAPADALTHMKGALVQGLGERVNVTLRASGTPRDATAELKAAAKGLDADLVVHYADGGGGGVLTAPRPGSLRVQTGALRALVPGFKESLDKQALATITSWPDLTVALDKLNLRLPSPGASGPDLRGSSVALNIQTGAMAGEMITPGPEGAASGPRQPFTLTPLTLNLVSEDLAKSVRLRGGGEATIGDQPAGTLRIDVSAAGLLDGSGLPVAGLPRRLSGTVLLQGVSTALAQPLVEAAGLDLPTDVGPRLDVDLRAAAKSADASSATIPTTDLDLSIRSAKIVTTVALVIDQNGLRGRDAQDKPAIEATLASGASIAGRLAERAGAARITGGGPMTIGISGLDVPFIAGGTSPALDRAAARVQIALSNVNVLPLYPGPDPQDIPAPPQAPPVQVKALDFAGTLAPGAAPRVTIDGQFAHAQSPFAVKGDFALEGLLQPQGQGKAPKVTPETVRPVGTLAITTAPTSLARLMPPPAPPAPGTQPLDVPRLIRDAIGPSVTVNAATAVAKGQGQADRLDVQAQIDSDGLKGQAAGAIARDRIALDKADLRASVAPQLVSTLLGTFAPTLEPRPSLAAPAVVTLAVDPLRIPLAPGGGFKPDFAGAGDVTARIGLDGRLLVQNLQVRNADGTVRDFGPAGLEGIQIVAGAPMKALMAEAAGVGVGTATVKAKLLAGAQGERLADLDGSARVELARGKPSGPLAATLKVIDANTAGLDRFLQKPGLLAGALGPTLSVDASADAQLPSPNGGSGAPYERINLSASLASATLKTDKPLKATLTPDRMGLDAPLVLKWTMDPAFANTHLLAPGPTAPGGPPPQATAHFTRPTDFTLSVTRLVLGPRETPMKPGVFGLNADVQTPALALALADGTPANFGAVSAKTWNGTEPGRVVFSLQMNAPGGAGASAPVAVNGAIDKLGDEQGRIATDRAVIFGNATAQQFPTALVDALARQNGMLVELLGPTVTLTAGGGDIPLSGAGGRGQLSAKLSSDRASADLKGAIRDGAFIAQGPVNTQLSVITPQLGERLVKGLPMVGTFQKTKEDGPAALTATGLTVPIDGDLRKLNGQLTLNVGQVRFETSKKFASILKILDQRQQGLVGQKLAPFTATITNGVMSYERYALPLGEFSVETQGVVDMVNRQLDVVTFIPLGALSDEAAGKFNTDLGKLLGNLPIIEQTTQLPWRTTGSFDNPETRPDLEAYAKNLGKQLKPLDALKKLEPFKKLEEKLKGGGG